MPHSWSVDDFCTIALSELKGDRDHSIQVDEIRHYKEIDGLEHEFLLAGVKHGKNRYLLRIERSTPARMRRTFWQKLKQTSASILPAFDSVTVSSLFKKLTTGMNRGPIILVATLRLSSAPLTLHDFCLLLSLFPSFSPTYKLKEEQCYWFCNVVLATISLIRAVKLDPGIGFKKAGKYGRFSIHMSLEARQLFIEGYKLVQRVQNQSSEELNDVELTAGTAQALVAMLSVHSEEARTRALLCVTSLSSSSFSNRRQLLDAGVADHLGLIFISSSTKVKALVFQALDFFGVSDFKPFPDAKLVKEAGISAIQDVFTEGDQKAMDSQHMKAIGDTIALLGDDRPSVYSWSARVISGLAWHEKCRPLILESILDMATSNVLEVGLTSIRVVMELSQYLDLQDIMIQAFPVLLHRRHRDVRVASIVSLRRLADQDQLRRQCITIFPLVALLFINSSDRIASEIEDLYFDTEKSTKRAKKVIACKLADLEFDDLYSMGLKAISAVANLLADGHGDVRQFALTFLTKAASESSYHSVILEFLPRIVGLIANQSWEGRQAAVDLLSSFISTAEFQLHIEEAIPSMFNLLRDDDSDVRRSTVRFITKAASERNFYPIILSLFPQIVDLLTDQSCTRRRTGFDLLSRLTPIAEFQPRVEETIPQVVQLLEHYEATLFMRRSLSYFYNHPAVIGAIPQLTRLLGQRLDDVCYTVANLLCDFIDYTNLHCHIQNIIPEVKTLQTHEAMDVRKSADRVMKKASEYGMV